MDEEEVILVHWIKSHRGMALKHLLPQYTNDDTTKQEEAIIKKSLKRQLRKATRHGFIYYNKDDGYYHAY